MHDIHVNIWTRDSPLSTRTLESTRMMNHQFLDLIALQPGDWSARWRLPMDVSARIAPLTAAQKSAAANCPYALFDLRFQDDGYWQLRLGSRATWRIADQATPDPRIVDFVRLILFFAWHVASATNPVPRLLLGMRETTAAAFRNATVDCLPALALSEAAHLTARWSTCAPYWHALTAAASGDSAAKLRRVQLYGLQLVAAPQLAWGLAARCPRAP